jgi:hypothetical protein
MALPDDSLSGSRLKLVVMGINVVKWPKLAGVALSAKTLKMLMSFPGGRAEPHHHHHHHAPWQSDLAKKQLNDTKTKVIAKGQKHMRKNVVHTIGLVTSLAILLALSTGCNKMQSKGRASEEQTSQSATGAAKQQTIEGCVVRAEQAYYIQPATGDKTKLNTGSQDVSAHVGHNVRVSGNMNEAGSQAPSGGTQTSAGGAGAGAAAPELVVTRVDVVAESCPPEIQKRIDADKDKDKTAPK